MRGGWHRRRRARLDRGHRRPADRHRARRTPSPCWPARSARRRKEAIDQAHEQGVKVAALIGRVEQAVRDVPAGRRHHHRPGLRGRRPHGRGGHDGARARRGRRRSPPSRCSPPAASGPAGRWRRRWRSAPTACGPARSGSPWPRTSRRPIITEKLLAATSTDTVRSRAYTGKPARQLRTAWTEAWEAPESPGTAADAAAVPPQRLRQPEDGHAPARRSSSACRSARSSAA